MSFVPPYRFRYARLLYLRWALAVPVIVAMIGLSTSYLFRGVTNAGTQPILTAFDRSPAVWPLIFGVPLVALICCLLGKRYISQAYVGCAVAFTLYGGSLGVGAVIADTSWAGASMAFALILVCFAFASIYARGR